MTHDAQAPSLEAIAGLARKYRTLLELRRMKREEGTVPALSTFRVLAREFPGALRELDTLRIEEIERRLADLDEAARGSAPSSWIAWMLLYHALMRAALHLKPRLSRMVRDGRPLTPEEATVLAEDTARFAGIYVDEIFVLSVARPRDGRLNALVFDVMAHRFAAPADALWEALFPARREQRY